MILVLFLNFFYYSKDIWSGTTTNTAGVVGLAYMLNVCTSSQYTIIEDIGGFAYVTVATHEIGHNLGAYHDGVSK